MDLFLFGCIAFVCMTGTILALSIIGINSAKETD